MLSSSYYKSLMSNLSGQISNKKKRLTTCQNARSKLTREDEYATVNRKLERAASEFSEGLFRTDPFSSSVPSSLNSEHESTPSVDRRLSSALESLKKEIEKLNSEIDNLQSQYNTASANYRIALEEEREARRQQEEERRQRSGAGSGK